MVRRTRFSIVSLLGVTAVFLSGCFIGAAVQAFGSNKTPVQQAATVSMPEPANPTSQPLVTKPVRTILVRGDGSFATGAADQPTAN